MMVLILQSVPAGVRGEIARWLVEPYPGVFVGHVSARVRDKLWEKCKAHKKVNGALQIWSTNTEQRYRMRGHGTLRREIIESWVRSWIFSAFTSRQQARDWHTGIPKELLSAGQ